jgi:hypothetical protein
MAKKSFLTALLVVLAVLGARAQNFNGKVVDETTNQYHLRMWCKQVRTRPF